MIRFRIAALGLTVAGLADLGQAQTIQVNKENRTIAITATDKVTAIADQATLHVGFIAYGPDSNTAYANGSKLSNAIVKALTDAGVPKETIQSENQQITPVQN
ncbi:MAG TPA: SIMPL domain-containing protein, partial [Edaphobacter sp.]